MKKRILSILLLCCMVLTLLPTAAFAADGKTYASTGHERPVRTPPEARRSLRLYAADRGYRRDTLRPYVRNL